MSYASALAEVHNLHTAKDDLSAFDTAGYSDEQLGRLPDVGNGYQSGTSQINNTGTVGQVVPWHRNALLSYPKITGVGASLVGSETIGFRGNYGSCLNTFLAQDLNGQNLGEGQSGVQFWWGLVRHTLMDSKNWAATDGVQFMHSYPGDDYVAASDGCQGLDSAPFSASVSAITALTQSSSGPTQIIVSPSYNAAVQAAVRTFRAFFQFYSSSNAPDGSGVAGWYVSTTSPIRTELGWLDEAMSQLDFPLSGLNLMFQLAFNVGQTPTFNPCFASNLPSGCTGVQLSFYQPFQISQIKLKLHPKDQTLLTNKLKAGKINLPYLTPRYMAPSTWAATQSITSVGQVVQFQVGTALRYPVAVFFIAVPVGASRANTFSPLLGACKFTSVNLQVGADQLYDQDLNSPQELWVELQKLMPATRMSDLGFSSQLDYVRWANAMPIMGFDISRNSTENTTISFRGIVSSIPTGLPHEMHVIALLKDGVVINCKDGMCQTTRLTH